MLNHYLKRWVRFVSKNKVITFLNLSGLILGIVSCLVIANYTLYELSYDDFQKEAGRTYRVTQQTYSNGEAEPASAYTDVPLAHTIKENISGVEDVFRLHFTTNEFLISIESDGQKSTHIENNAYYADEQAVKYLDLNFIRGDSSVALQEPGHVILSESMAFKYLGKDWRKTDLVGNTLIYAGDNRNYPFIIDGVFKDYPSNSHLNFDFLFSHSSLYQILGGDDMPKEMVKNMMENMWGHPQWYTYVVLAEDGSATNTAEKLNAYIREFHDDPTDSKEIIYSFQPVSSIHLTSRLANEAENNSNEQLVWLLVAVAILIIILAWSNYLNLSVVLSLDRLKEIGLRKTIGAGPGDLYLQFASEAIFLQIMVFGIAIALYSKLLPYVSKFLDITLTSDSLFTTRFWLLTGGLFMGTLLLTTIHKVIMLKRINPKMAISGIYSTGRSGTGFKKIMVGVQFIITIILVTSTIMINQQIRYIQEKDTGMVLSDRIVIRGPKSIEKEEEFRQMFDVFKDRITDYPEVGQVSASAFLPGQSNLWQKQLVLPGNPASEASEVKEISVSPDFINQLGIDFIAGTTFSSLPARQRQQVILNQQAIEVLGYRNPQEAVSKGVDVVFGGGKTLTYEVAGIVSNFHQHSPRVAYQPMAFFTDLRTGYFILEATGSSNESLIEKISAEWNNLFPEEPFDFFFLEDFYKRQFREDRQFANIFNSFTFIAILIACMGVFGLTNYMVRQRQQEMGIRRILGASVNQVASMFIKYYTGLIVFTSVVGIPISYISVNQWINDYAFRVELNHWIFVLPLIILFALTLLSAGYGMWRASHTNPADVLRQQ